VMGEWIAEYSHGNREVFDVVAVCNPGEPVFFRAGREVGTSPVAAATAHAVAWIAARHAEGEADVGLLRLGPSPVWVPWPTHEGAWWFRWTTSLLAEPCIARRAGSGFSIERCGVEEELFHGCDDLSAGVEFCPVEPTR